MTNLRAISISLPSTVDRVAAVYGSLFLALGIYLPFYPLLLADRGMSDTEISILIAAPMALRVLFASPLGLLADRIGSRRRVLMLYSAIPALVFSVFYWSDSFSVLLLVTTVTSLFANAAVPVTDALATTIVRHGIGDYGRMRMWGSIAFVAANLGAGAVVSGLTPKALFWLLLCAFWGSFFVLSVFTPTAIAAKPLATKLKNESSVYYLKDSVLLAGMSIVALIQASHAMLYSFSSIYWGSIGFSGTTIGLFWAVGVISEILMFYFSGQFIRKFGVRQLLVFSATLAILRWFLFPLPTTILGYLALQSFHSVTFALSYLAMMRLIVMRVADKSAATVQGLYASLSALTMALATLASGPLYRSFGVYGFQFMSLLPALALLIVVTRSGLTHATSRELP